MFSVKMFPFFSSFFFFFQMFSVKTLKGSLRARKGKIKAKDDRALPLYLERCQG